MIKLSTKSDCCGCWACAQACPTKCISMPEDNEGFRYPQINESKCIECKLCEKVCPISNYKKQEYTSKRTFLVQHKDERVLNDSTSGGAFSAIAEYVIKQGGVVFGAVYEKDYVVAHDFVDDIEGLHKFRNSKYVQSIIGDAFTKVRYFLDRDRKVLFSGTPCQVEALLNYLRKPYKNLFTVDFVCHSIPSPLVLHKYLELQEKKIGKISSLRFRDKHRGYKYSNMALVSASGEKYNEGIDTDVYLRAFFSDMSIRQSCSTCKFRPIFRRSDFTIWDCFEVGDLCPELDNDKGVTRVLCQSTRAVDILNSLNKIASIVEIPFSKAVNVEREEKWKISLNPKRNEFFHDLNDSSLTPEQFFNKYFPITMKCRIEKFFRIILGKVGFYQQIKKIYKYLK